MTARFGHIPSEPMPPSQTQLLTTRTNHPRPAFFGIEPNPFVDHVPSWHRPKRAKPKRSSTKKRLAASAAFTAPSLRRDLPANIEIAPWEWTGPLADLVDLDNEADEEERQETEAAQRRKADLDWQQKRDAFDLFRALPPPWRAMLLQRHGGMGIETADDLALSLSEEPQVRGFSGQSWRHDAWQSVQHLRSVAEGIAGAVASLKHVDQAALPFLAASDSDLLSIAEREAEVATRIHNHRLRITDARQRRAALHRERLAEAEARGATAEEVARLHVAIDECLDITTAETRVEEARARLEAARAANAPVRERRASGSSSKCPNGPSKERRQRFKRSFIPASAMQDRSGAARVGVSAKRQCTPPASFSSSADPSEHTCHPMSMDGRSVAGATSALGIAPSCRPACWSGRPTGELKSGFRFLMSSMANRKPGGRCGTRLSSACATMLAG